MNVFARGRTALLIAALAACLLPAGCGKEEYVFTHHETVVEISAGGSFTVELTAVPEGHSASEYTWTEGANGDPIEVGADGSVSPRKSGRGTVVGTLKAGKTVYRETFEFLMHPARGGIGLDETELTFVLDTQGMKDFKVPTSAVLNLVAEPDLVYGEETEWTSSDPAVAGLNSGGKTGLAAHRTRAVVPKAAGTAGTTGARCRTARRRPRIRRAA